MRDFKVGDRVIFEMAKNSSREARWDGATDLGASGTYQEATVESLSGGLLTVVWQRHNEKKNQSWCFYQPSSRPEHYKQEGYVHHMHQKPVFKLMAENGMAFMSLRNPDGTPFDWSEAKQRKREPR